MLSFPKCSLVHIDSGWFAVHNHVTHVCSACGSKFWSDSTCVGIESDAAPMLSVLLNAELGDEDIAFLCGHVMLAQSQFSNNESMHYAHCQAFASVLGSYKLHNAVLCDGAPIVPIEALEL